jgi:hypothetical protein
VGVVKRTSLKQLTRQLAVNPHVKAGDIVLDPPDYAAERMQHIIDDSHAAYIHANLERAKNKHFRNQTDFIALGTHVSSKSGWVGTPLSRRHVVATYILRVIQYGKATKKLMQKLLGLLIHPFSHRKCLMAILQFSYRWTETLSEHTETKLNFVVRDELLACLMLLPFAASSVRWPISEEITATDATPLMGGVPE